MFFKGSTTVNEIKAEYRRLCFLHHPDIGGDTATMQQVNAAYHKALEQAHGQTSEGSDGKQHTYYYKQDVEQAVMDKIEELLALQLPDIDILLVGVWIWVEGNTRPVKEQLKQVKMQWHSKRQKWCWHMPNSKSRYNKSASFDDICEFYGVNQFTPQEKIALPT